MLFQMNIILQSIILSFILHWTVSAPVGPNEERKARSLGFLDYLQPEIESFDIDNNDYLSIGIEENDLSRTVPSRKTVRPQSYNSPIYYIRLPPQPYMFVPGLGYVSQNTPSAVSQFVNLPMPFVANGKPSNIYQWSGTFQGFPTQPPPTNSFPGFSSPPAHPPLYTTSMKPVKKPLPESTVHRLPGTFTFNGKPEDIFVLRDSYNSLYSDVLQNVYP